MLTTITGYNMSFIEQQLLADERVLYRAKLHPIIFFYPSCWIIMTLAIAFIPLPYIGLVAIATGLICINYWYKALVKYFSAEYVLTNKRVFIKIGFFRHYSMELFLQKIEGIRVKQGVIARMLGYGTIIIIGTGGSQDPFSLVSDPLLFRRYVQKEIERTLLENPLSHDD